MAYYFGVEDCKIAPWTSTGVYGTAVRVDAINSFEIGMETVNAQLEGRDKIEDVHAVQTVGTIRARFAFSNPEVYEIMTGATAHTISGTTYHKFGTNRRPYFGMCAKSDSTDTDGVVHLFAAKCKVMEAFSYSFNYGEYATPEINMMCVEDGDYGVIEIFKYDSDVEITIPPVYNGL